MKTLIAAVDSVGHAVIEWIAWSLLVVIGLLFIYLLWREVTGRHKQTDPEKEGHNLCSGTNADSSLFSDHTDKKFKKRFPDGFLVQLEIDEMVEHEKSEQEINPKIED